MSWYQRENVFINDVKTISSILGSVSFLTRFQIPLSVVIIGKWPQNGWNIRMTQLESISAFCQN